MRVLYDYQAFDMQTFGGVSRCFSELYRRLPLPVEAKLGVRVSDNVYLRQLGFPRQEDLYENFLCTGDSLAKKVLYKLYYNFYYHEFSRWDRRPRHNRSFSIRLLKENKYDVFHPTFYDDYFLEHLGKKPFVLTVHDMIPELYPQFYPEDEFQKVKKRILVPKARHIIAVSNRTKEDLMRLFHVPEERISVVYHGADTEPLACSPDSLFGFPYMLYVGDRHLYKNFGLFCRACLPVLRKYKEVKVVCTGKPFNREETLFFQEKGVADRFVHKFIRSDRVLFDVYHHALVFVYPSAYEGFGIPILEAYKAGCPVMLNEAGCFPEIAGDAAVYFHIGENSSDFAERFDSFMSLSARERDGLLRRQEERLRKFTWQDAARKLADVYEHIS